MSTSDVRSTAPDEKLTGDVSVISVLEGRASSYRMFSRMFLKPLSETDIDEIIESDYAAAAETLAGTGALADGFNDMGRYLRKRNTGTRQLLATDFTMCFDGVEAVGGEVAVPYASIFIGKEALLNQEPRHRAYRIYQTESVKLKAGINLPEDHLSFELEFLSILSDRAAAAYKRGNREETVRNLEVSREFINEHILSWYDLFMERAGKVLKTRFYRGVMKATKGYLELDLSTIADLMDVA